MATQETLTAEERRLAEDARRETNWKRWGPYLAERQWGTVREDYSAWGSCWEYFPHDQARSRVYRWGEDGLLGITDRQGRLCFALALWNGRDPILKERLFGLTGPEGNHGEDVKELYYYLDSTPTHSYMKALYKYPQAEYPYAWLVEENRRRGKDALEFELVDTGVFNENRYFDVFAEYAKAALDDVLIRITVANRGPETATLHLLPTLWFRNTWSWGRTGEGYYRLQVPAGKQASVRLRLCAESEAPHKPIGQEFDQTFEERIQEADEFYTAKIPAGPSQEERRVARQGYAGLLWSKQFFHYSIKDWLEGDPALPAPPANRLRGRNADWAHLYNRDIISMPDKWEYPWYAAWDLAFHMIPFAKVDPHFAKEQLALFLREWYMHPNGQIPAYEFAFSDVNPPVHAWSAWRVYKMTGPRGKRDRRFLASVFQKLLINFTWWVNRKDVEGKHLFSGGFLGLDNIGVFDRSRPLPTGGHLEQADGTAWMAFYCSTMLAMALELAREDMAYEDVASKFFEHFVAIVDAMNTLGGTGLWDEEDGFYYDQLHVEGKHVPLRIRSMVGLIPLYAAEVLEADAIQKLPGFSKRLRWFLANRPDLARHISYMEGPHGEHGPTGMLGGGHRLLAIPSRERLTRVLRYLLGENEFLSPYGIRSISRIHMEQPYVFRANGDEFRVDYVPGESNTGLFGGNSNWRGPIWFPVNYLLVEALERYHYFYGDSLRVEYPTGSGRMMNLKEVANGIAMRLARIFLPDQHGRRPCHGDDRRYAQDPYWRDLVLFYEYFHGETGRGVGASHQTGWTALATRFIEVLGQTRK